jgi:hypothetical protein
MPFMTKERGQYSGFCADLMEEIAKRCDIDYVFREVKDGKYGTKQPDGTWNGMIGELTRRVRET